MASIRQCLNMDNDKTVLPVPDYVAFDLETTGLSPDDDEMLEIAFVKFRAGRPVERWSTFVRPSRSVPLKTLRLTHIPKDQLEQSLPFMPETAKRIDEFRGTLPLVGHNSSFDTAFLRRVMPGFPGVDVYDTLELARIVFPGFSSYRLSDLASRLGVQVTEAHRAYDDAEVAGTLFRIIQENALMLGVETRQRIVSLMGSDWLPRSMFDFDEGRRQRALFGPLVQTAAPSRAVSMEWLRDAAVELLRSPEKDRVFRVPSSLDAAIAVAEAALAFSQETGKKVLLLGFPDQARDSRMGVVHSPGSYLCLHRFGETMRLAVSGALNGLDVESRRYLASVASWAERTQDGLLREVQAAGNWELVSELACPEDLGCKDMCPQALQCFALKGSPAKSPAFAKLDGLRSLLGLDNAGGWDRVLVWEFHQLSREARRFEAELNLSAVQSSLGELGLIEAIPLLQEISARTDVSKVRSMVPKLVEEVRRAVLQAKSRFQEAHGPYESPVLEGPPVLYRGIRFLERCARALSEIADEQAGTELVMETVFGEGGVRQHVLARRGLRPGAGVLEGIRAAAGEPIFLSSMSETICSSKGLKWSYGLPDAVSARPLKPGTGAADNVLFLQVEPYPVPSPSQYGQYLKDLILLIARVRRTGVQVMFPSRSLIKEVYPLVAGDLEQNGIVLYAQGIDGGHRVLEHLGEEDAVVFSTAVPPGPEDPVPSCLVVAKVPFAPPNAMDDLRRVEVSRLGLDPFVEVNVRQAALAVRAHVQPMVDRPGKSVVVMADPKACPGRSRWAQDFLSSFSDLPRVSCPPGHVVARLSGWNSEDDVKGP